MASLVSIIFALMPHRLIGAAILHRRFEVFAHANNLVYIGSMQADEDEPVRGFTAHTGQIDNYVVSGSVAGHDLTLLKRTVVHRRRPHAKRSCTHAWLIARIPHDVPHSRHALLLSHDHSRMNEEAVFLKESRSTHIAVNAALDASFLIYAKRGDVSHLQDSLAGAVSDSMLAHPQYDYEIDDSALYVYSRIADPTAHDLDMLLKATISLADAYTSR